MIPQLLAKIKQTKIFRIFKFFLKSNSLQRLISSKGRAVICLDIGAAIFEHSNWFPFLNSKNTIWIASDPNATSLNYLKNWTWNSKLIVEKCALSKNGGALNFYETNQITGSSLKEINISKNIAHRIEMNYFYPIKKKKITTKSIKKLLDAQTKFKNIPIFVKIDTQGYVLELIQGMENYFQKKQICGLEVESSLLSDPIYKKGSKFSEITSFLEKKDFELLKLDVHYFKKNQLSKNFTVNECDSIFSLKQSVINKKKLNFKISMLQFYASYNLYDEIRSLYNNNQDLKLLFGKDFLKKNQDYFT
jgi:FkbM family methyltransferase